MTKIEILRYGFGEHGYSGPRFNTIAQANTMYRPIKAAEGMLEYFRKAQNACSVLELLDGKVKSSDEGDGCRESTEFGAKLGIGNKFANTDESSWRINTDICVNTGIGQSLTIGIKNCHGCTKPGDSLIVLNKLTSWDYVENKKIKELLLVSNSILGSEHKSNDESVSKIKQELYAKKEQLQNETSEICKNCTYVKEILKSLQIQK